MKKTDIRTGINRRQALKYLSASGAALLLECSRPGLGQAHAVQTAQPVRIGALLPVSGDADAYARQMRMGIETAVSEINATGGVLGRPMEVAVRDSETAPATLPDRCRELVEDWGAVAIVGPWVSAGRKYASRFLAERGIPLVNAANHEGEFCHPNLFSVGPTTAHNGHALTRYLAESDKSENGASYFLLGSYPSWQNSMFRQLRFPIYRSGGKIHGQALTTTGERNFKPIIRWIQETGAKTVLFCVMRHHGQEFIHQAGELGLLDKITIGWIGFNEILAEGLSVQERQHIITTSPFVSSDPEGGVPDFVARVRRQHGAEVPVSYCALTHYNAVKALKAAWERSGEVSPEAGNAGLAGLTFDSPTGPVTIDATHHHATMNIVVAKGSEAGLQVVKRLGQVAAEPGCG